MAIRHHIAHIEAYRRQPRDAEQFDPILLAAGLKVPAMSAKDHAHMRSRATVYVAAQAAKVAPRSAAQKAHSRQTRTVEGKIVRQEVRSILGRLRWLGAVRG